MTGTATGVARPLPPRLTANPAPPRRAGSLRRTASIDVAWPDGLEGARILHGRARDVLTPEGAGGGTGGGAGGGATVLGSARVETTVTPDRTITAITATPAADRLAHLVGERGGGHLRLVMSEKIPELINAGTPLYLLLDDISGVSLISNWAWSLWRPDWLERSAKAMLGAQADRPAMPPTNVCWGFQPGHSSHDRTPGNGPSPITDGGELRNPADPEGWHEFPAIDGVSMRRARRIEVWRDAADGLIHVDSAFQDSAPRPDGGRTALHEYNLSATLDPETLTLRGLEIDPRVLPFHECPGAIANALKLVGTPLPEIRAAVLDRLRGPAGCTHLNDALRALGEVPALLRQLPG